jgi:hypothetical protein
MNAALGGKGWMRRPDDRRLDVRPVAEPGGIRDGGRGLNRGRGDNQQREEGGTCTHVAIIGDALRLVASIWRIGGTIG